MMLTLEAIGPEGERLALAAADAVDVAVGWDAEFNCATFDSDEHDEGSLRGVVFEALEALDTRWQEQLREAE